MQKAETFKGFAVSNQSHSQWKSGKQLLQDVKYELFASFRAGEGNQKMWGMKGDEKCFWHLNQIDQHLDQGETEIHKSYLNTLTKNCLYFNAS